MKLLDANILIYAVNADAADHRAMHRWFSEALSGKETVAFAWLALLAFVRVSTKAALFAKPLSVTVALAQVEEWLSLQGTVVLDPGPRHAAILRELLEPVGTGGNLTSDAHLAAIAIEHGAELISRDTDFGRFPGLRWRDPLSGR